MLGIMTITDFALNLLAVLSGLVIFSIGRRYVGGYLGEKGKNLATKEDIEEITDKVEAIKNSYALVIEEFRKREQLRFAALDKRLEVHQEAFALWWNLLGSLHSERVIDNVIACQNFWVDNNLYLSAEAGHAFRAAFVAVGNHKDLVESGRGQGNEAAEKVRRNFSAIKEAGNIIVKAVELPPLHDSDMPTNEKNPA